MNFMEKLFITLTPHNCRYSSYVDAFIKSLVSEGKLIAHGKYRVEIKWRGAHYGIWIENYPYADLADVKKYSDNTFLYRKLRPSRATQIAFWDWMNEQGVYPNRYNEVPTDKNLKVLLNNTKNYGGENVKTCRGGREMNKIESHKSDYPSMQGYMEQEEIKNMATCPSTHDEHDLYAAAHCLVSERTNKFDLIDMVYAMLKREHSEKSKHTPVLEWTNEPPKVPGYYWYRCSNENIWSPAYVFIVTEITQYGTLEGSKQEQWAGPIPEPREPKD